MSFSMFLTNEVSRIVWFGLLDALGQDALSSNIRWALWSIGFAGAFVAAAVFRYGFDRPVQTWLNPSRRAGSTRRSADATERAMELGAGPGLPAPGRPGQAVIDPPRA